MFGTKYFSLSLYLFIILNCSRGIWESNLNKVQQHNFEADLGLHTYWLGMNKFADMVRPSSNILLLISFSY